MILSGAMRLPGPAGPLIVSLILCETLISFGWMLHVAQKIFLGAPLTAVEVPADPPLAMNVTLIVLMIGCVAVPFVGMRLVEWVGR